MKFKINMNKCTFSKKKNIRKTFRYYFMKMRD